MSKILYLMCSVYQIGLSYNLCMTLNNTNLLYLFLKVSKKLETTKCYYRCAELKFMKIKRSMLQIKYLRIVFFIFDIHIRQWPESRWVYHQPSIFCSSMRLVDKYRYLDYALVRLLVEGRIYQKQRKIFQDSIRMFQHQ